MPEAADVSQALNSNFLFACNANKYWFEMFKVYFALADPAITTNGPFGV